MPTNSSDRLSPEEELLRQAEQLLDDARRSGDRRRELAALADLGEVYRRGGDVRRAFEFLEPALALAREFGDGPRELDVLDNLGMASLMSGQAGRAVEILDRVVAGARDIGNRYREKIALEHLATAHMVGKQNSQALSVFEAALNLARELGDQHHAADLLWYLAILNADLEQPDQAVRRAEEAIQLYQQQGNPYVGWLTQQVQRYRQGTDLRLTNVSQTQSASLPESLLGSWSVTTSGTPAVESRPARGEPSLLRMAISAAKSVSKFFSSGFQTVSQTAYDHRLQTCAACEHHTGVRCSLCGCFCSIKAWMPHEDCPIGKWPQ